MDPRLLRLYNEELAHLREMGAEFAAEYPKVARRLAMDGLEVADPYVERLLEGFAFMAARTQLKLEAEYPQLVANLLEAVHPNFLAPVPSLMVARLHPELDNPALAQGLLVPRGSAITSQTLRGQNTRCEFRTAHELRLWPLELTQVQYFLHAPDLPLAQLPQARSVRSGLRLRLKVHGGLSAAQLKLGSLPVHISAAAEVGWRLHELVGAAAVGTLVWPVAQSSGQSPAAPPSTPSPAAQWREAASSVQPLGYDDEHALLPQSLRGLSAYRLLQELAALPQRFLFFELQELAPRLAALGAVSAKAGAPAPEWDVLILFSRAEPDLPALVDVNSLALNCTPAINLFPKRLDRIQVDLGANEFHAVPDRTRPMDFEVHSIQSLIGYGSGSAGVQVYLPLYAAAVGQDGPAHATAQAGAAGASAGTAGVPAGAAETGYFSTRRVPRLLSQRQVSHGTRTGYVGSEVYLALSHGDAQPATPPQLRQLAVSALVSNRDLPVLLGGTPSGEPNQQQLGWALDGVSGLTAVECLRGPTRPNSRAAWGAHGWALVNHLNLNHVSLAADDPPQAAAALREVLALYGPAADASWQKLVQALVGVRAQTVTRRLPQGGPLAFGSGVLVSLQVDEQGLPGASAYLLGAVLDRVLARQAAINSFTQTRLESLTRGLLVQWPPRVGQQAMLSP